MIVALAGRRVDATDAEVSRFPLQNASIVRERLKTLFERRKINGLVCSAACGADLLALDVAGELSVRRRIILPFKPSRFRETSVVDRPGEWGPLFDRIYQATESENGVVVINDAGDDEEAYIATNKRILDDATSLAAQHTGKQVEKNDSQSLYENDVLVVVVWEGASRGDDDVTAEFAESSRRRGLEVAQVLTK